jgi:hypothetical protein
VLLFHKDNGIQVLNKLSENPNIECYVKGLITLLDYQIDIFKRLDHLNGLENSGERDVTKLKELIQ